ncbi:MAG: hypothetical protein AVDCRST_MAG85-3869, partial [uncultured Solirubrobacteraceae bacterium]
ATPPRCRHRLRAPRLHTGERGVTVPRVPASRRPADGRRAAARRIPGRDRAPAPAAAPRGPARASFPRRDEARAGDLSPARQRRRCTRLGLRRDGRQGPAEPALPASALTGRAQARARGSRAPDAPAAAARVHVRRRRPAQRHGLLRDPRRHPCEPGDRDLGRPGAAVRHRVRPRPRRRRDGRGDVPAPVLRRPAVRADHDRQRQRLGRHVHQPGRTALPDDLASRGRRGGRDVPAPAPVVPLHRL